MVPATWMVLTHVIMLPINNRASIHQGFNLLPFRQAIYDITQNMVSLNETMVLDTSMWWQINNIKSTHLFHSIVSSLEETAIFDQHSIVIKAKSRLSMVDSTAPLIRSRNSITYAPVAYGPSII
jgi:hypothetical protein